MNQAVENASFSSSSGISLLRKLTIRVILWVLNILAIFKIWEKEKRIRQTQPFRYLSTLYFIMLKNGQACFKNLVVLTTQDF